MDFTGSIADLTAPLSAELGSTAGFTGSSFVDTMSTVAVSLPRFLLQVVADIGADLGSTMGA